MNAINRFNIWYDRLPGTPRFLLFIVMMSVAVFPLQLGLSLGRPVMALFGLVGLSLMAFVASVRAGTIHGKLATFGIAFLMISVALMTIFLVFAK